MFMLQQSKLCTLFQLPEMTIACLVKYYYSWKKTRTRTSLMDRQARKLASHRDEGSEGGSEHGSNTDSDSEEKVNLSRSASENNVEGNKSESMLPISNKTNLIKLSLDRTVKHHRVSDCAVGNDGASEAPVLKKKRHSPITVQAPSPSKRRLLSMPAPKSVKLYRAQLGKPAAVTSMVPVVGRAIDSRSNIHENRAASTVTNTPKPVIEVDKV